MPLPLIFIPHPVRIDVTRPTRWVHRIHYEPLTHGERAVAGVAAIAAVAAVDVVVGDGVGEAGPVERAGGGLVRSVNGW